MYDTRKDCVDILYTNGAIPIWMFTIAGIGNFIDFYEKKLVQIVILFKSNCKWALEFTETRLWSH